MSKVDTAKQLGRAAAQEMADMAIEHQALFYDEFIAESNRLTQEREAKFNRLIASLVTDFRALKLSQEQTELLCIKFRNIAWCTEERNTYNKGENK